MRGGLPTTYAEIQERLLEAPDILIEAGLEREIELERRARRRLGAVQARIGLLQGERARRRGVTQTFDPS